MGWMSPKRSGARTPPRHRRGCPPTPRCAGFSWCTRGSGWRRHDNRAVVEGRDIGSVVFPEATVKVYLDARPEVRAQRRADQTGKEQAGVLAELRARDERDSTRQASPLIVPEGAVVIDTSDMTVDEVVDRIVELAGEAAG